MKHILLLIIFGWNLGFSQTIKIDLNHYGGSKFDGFVKRNFALPLYQEKKGVYYAELPARFFNDTLQLLITKEKNSPFPKNIKCLNMDNKPWTFNYNADKRLLTITEGDLKKETHFYNLSAREGNIKSVCQVKNKVVSDTSMWLGIERKRVKYGYFSLNNMRYAIAIAGLNTKTPQGNDASAISIDTSSSMYHNIVSNARCNSISNTKYLDFEGNFFRINKVDRDGEFIEIEKCDAIVEDSCIYIDTYLRAFNYKYEGGDFDIQEILDEGKYVVINVWSEYCPPCIRSIPVLEELQEKYKDKVTLLSLFAGNQKALTKLEDSFTMSYSLGIISEEIRNDIMVDGYPYKAIIAPDGKIIKLGFRGTKKLEEYIQSL